MKALLGDEWPAFLNSFSLPAQVSIRLNPLKPAALQGNKVPWCSLGLYLPERPVFTLDPLFHAGAYYVQEASSMFLEQFIRQLHLGDKPLRILDAAAAPGGKSTHLLSLMHPESLLVCNEVIQSRVPVLKENLTRWGYPNTIITSNDPADLGKLRGFFDVIVLDAPCSGEGLFRKDPSAVKHWSPANVQHCAHRQQRIIRNLWPALKQHGILIYSTCTYNKIENEEIISPWIEERAAEAVTLEVPAEWNIVRSSVSTPGYRFYPHRVKGEGFFITALRKLDEERTLSTRTKPPKIPDRLVAAVRNYFCPPFETGWLQWNEQVVALPDEQLGNATAIFQNLKVVGAGTAAARVAGNKIIPLHSLAMSVYLNKTSFRTASLQKDEALAYLRKEAVRLSGISGYGLVEYNGIPLGWVNVMAHRVNNLYPAEWRIRMKNPAG